jgi:uncharacterized membrane protein
MHKAAVDQLQYAHTDVWRGQQFYTTIDTTIIGIAVAVLRIGGAEEGATILLFVVGMIVAGFGFQSVKRLRIYFLEAVVNLAVIERLLSGLA